MIEFLLMCGFIWIILKILTAIVALPFAILGAVLQGPTSIIFWIVLIALIVIAYRSSRDHDRSSGTFRMNRLYRSETNRWICGVCGGIGDYFRVDPSIVRLIFALLCLIGGGSLLVVYFIAALIIPRESSRY